MNLRIVHIIFCVFCYSQYLAASTLDLQSHRYSVKDGMACNTVNDITQDSEGYIWLATANGFSRFDGYNFVNFTQLNLGEKTETASNISLLLNDRHNGLVWGYTPQQAIYCYALNKGRFVDFSPAHVRNHFFYNKYLSYDGLWLFSADFGVRHITYNQKVFTTQDYTVENGLLQSTRDLSVSEDRKHNVWITSDQGVMRIPPTGKRQVLLKGKRVKVHTLQHDYFAVLAEGGDAYLYHIDGKLLLRSHLPAVMSVKGKSRGSMIWNGYWYIFSEGDTYAMDIHTGRFFKPSIQIPGAIDKNPLRDYTCLYDKKGNLYLFGKGGFYKQFHLIEDMTLVNARDKNFSVAEDSYGRVFIASYGKGLYVYLPKEDELQHFSMNDEKPIFDTDLLLNIFVDKTNCIWISTGYGFYRVTEADGLQAKYVKPVDAKHDEWNNYVRHISYIGKDQLLVSTKNNLSYIYNVKTEKFVPKLHTDAIVYSYKIDAQGHTWIATKGAGMMLDGQKYTIKDPVYKVPTNKFYDFAFDRLGRTWIATWEGGLLLTKYEKGRPLRFQQFMSSNPKEKQIHSLFIDRKGNLWISSNDGLAMVDTKKKIIGEKDILHFNSSNHTLPISQITCGLEDKKGTYWFGSASGVLRCQFDEKTQKLNYEVLNTAKGLINNSVRSLSEDAFGNIWVTTEEGLSRVDSRTVRCKSFLLGSQISENAYSENCTSMLSDGRIAFGSENGMLILNPSKSKDMGGNSLHVTVTNLIVNGVSVFDKELESFLDDALSYSNEITLPYDKNSLSVCFSNFCYPDIGTTMYQYYMEGLDKDWRPMTSLNHADFSDLHPGHYTLHLRTLGANGNWSKETCFRIVIAQPWYNTWWAWLVYLCAIIAIGVFMYREWRKNFELSQQMRVEKQMNDFRIDFFTHISHEFRTPLAIIQNAVGKLLEDGGNARYTLSALGRSAKRLQRLINQLMEFRKLNTGNVKLSVEQGDVVGFVRDIYYDLYAMARQKELTMTFLPWTNKFEMVFDQQKLENITYNLLSNAIKYTPDGGIVTVKLLLQGENIVLTVEDNGAGISPSREKELFRPFMHGYVSKGGMGIGLYTAYEMAVLHKGSLTYQRSKKLGGSLFTLTIPSKAKYYEGEDYLEKTALDTSSMDKREVDTIVKEMSPQSINQVLVIVIEDDLDMMEQIKSELSVYFHVVGYTNGKVGFENVKKMKPALLISDVMLPDMSGYEIVSSLKADPEIQDIPVIMLTAFDDTNHVLKAYKSFVDDYMIKPCNFKLLIARSLQFVAKYQKNKKRTSVDTVSTKPLQEVSMVQEESAPIIMSPLDKKFKDKLEAIVTQHLGDRDFNVDRLAELLNLGRTTVYNRTKSIMGVSPNMYIQNERLRVAAKLLLESDCTVSEISYKVGFSDATYFYKCFKNKFGVAPSKYGK